jgi:Fur family ferric uptake transcriptional regulator
VLRLQFSRVVRDLGQELIPEDETIVERFLDSDRHLTETELHAAVGDPAIDLAHIRRALRLLCDLGIAQPIRLDGHHDHLICVRCGSIVEFLDRHIEELQRGTCQAYGFTPLLHKLEIRGVCRQCAAALPVTRALASCLRGEVVEIADVLGGHGLKQRLLAMGLTRGTLVSVLSGDGPVVVEVRGSRMALGRGEAAKVIVKQPAGASPRDGGEPHGADAG